MTYIPEGFNVRDYAISEAARLISSAIGVQYEELERIEIDSTQLCVSFERVIDGQEAMVTIAVPWTYTD